MMGDIYDTIEMILKDYVPKTELKKLVVDLKNTPQVGDFKGYVLYRIEKILEKTS